LRVAHRILLAITYAALTSAVAVYVGMRLDTASVWVIAGLVIVSTIAWSSHMIVSRVTDLHDVLGNALRAFRDGDFSLRLTERGDRELAELKHLYNELADAVRHDRQDIHQKEVLLDTILQRTPVAVLLLNAADRIIYSNGAARELFAAGARLDGRAFAEILPTLAVPLREALASPDDTLFSAATSANADVETFHLSQRVFRLNTLPHRLLLIERLTPELRRQEVAVWKKAIRVMNHEINNSIAPISSLFHSARRAQEMPEHRHRLDEIHELIDERLLHLRTFLEGYARFARLPEPHKERVAWSDLLSEVQALYAFRVEGTPSVVCRLDRAQMQQVLINLVKNAHESGSDPGEVVVVIQSAAADCVLRVLDRGRGMSEEVMRQALIPFYSTKPNGSGLGLPLCNEIVEAHGGRMRLAAREGGGTEVTAWVPVG